jgi:hypothetical protein
VVGISRSQPAGKAMGRFRGGTKEDSRSGVQGMRCLSGWTEENQRGGTRC